MFKRFLFLVLLAGSIQLQAQADLYPKKINYPHLLEEISGLHLQAPDAMWWQNDSGNRPVLYQTDRSGAIRDSMVLAVPNKDWEDLAHDHKGTFFIGDFGNNCNCRRDLKIYLYRPADNHLDSINFHYPDQTAFPPSKPHRNFDMEGFFYHNDSLHLFSKNHWKHGDFMTKHYVLPAKPGNYTAILRDSLDLKNRVVTGAAISQDGATVALVAYRFRKLLGFIPNSAASVFIFRGFEEGYYLQGDRYKQVIPPFFIATQYEAIDFLDSRSVYVGSERTLFIRPRAKLIILKEDYFEEPNDD